MHIKLKYGQGDVSFSISDTCLKEVAEPNPMPAKSDPVTALQQAMAKPLGSRLEDVVHRGDKVLLLTVDFTRPSPKLLLGPLREELHKLGAEVDVMVALGNHRLMTKNEIKKHLGIADVLQNDPKGDMWKLGVTSFGTPVEVDRRLKGYDRRVALGFVEPSYLLGFTGGRKIIMPGVASSRAIARNHFLILRPGRKLGVLHGNPLSDDALEFAKAVGLDWIVDIVLNPDDSYAAVYCGDMESANEAACKDCAAIYEHKFYGKADIVVVGCGGYPYDCDLVQTKKGIVPAMECVRPGGTIILVGECTEGWGTEGLISRHALSAMKPEDILANLREKFESGDCPWESAPCSARYLFSKAVGELHCQVIVVTAINADFDGTFIETAPTVQEALSQARSRLGSNASVAVIPDGRRLIPV